MPHSDHVNRGRSALAKEEKGCVLAFSFVFFFAFIIGLGILGLGAWFAIEVISFIGRH